MALDPTLVAVSQNLQALDSAVRAASPLNDRSLVELGSLILSAQAAAASVDAALAVADSQINENGVFGVVAGGFAPDMVSGLLAQLKALNNQTILRTQRACLGRILLNFQTAGG